MGKRPDLLKQTLRSLFQFHQFSEVIAINDFGDEATNNAFREICPQGKLVDLGKQVGHHSAVDAMYSLVTTPYIFHCEDDWLFTAAPNLEQSLRLLENPDISVVCYRSISDFKFLPDLSSQIEIKQYQNIEYNSLINLHDQWHGYTFNPHLSKIELWQKNKPFSKFKKERHISRWQRSLNHHVAFIVPGCCHHIGEETSVANPKANKNLMNKIKTWKKSLRAKIAIWKNS